jgi:hypothetical protein
MTWRFIPGESVSHLPSDPLGSWIARHAYSNQSSSRVPKNDKAVEQLERDRSHHEQIKRSNAGSVITQECLPTLRGWPIALTLVSLGRAEILLT